MYSLTGIELGASESNGSALPITPSAPNVSGKEAVKEEAAEARNRQKNRAVGNKLKDEFLYLYYIFNLYYTACRGNKVLFVF